MMRQFGINLFEKARNSVFWICDFLKGQPIRRHYKDIKFINENFNTTDAAERQSRHLTNLLSYAVNNTDYYKDYIGFKGLESFPVIDKNKVRNNYSKFISINSRRKSLKKVLTSGSTGTPFAIYQDKNKVKRHIADNIYFNELANCSLGARLYYMRIWSKLDRKGWITRVMQNISKVDVSSVNPKKIQTLLSRLKKDRSTKSMVAYASSYDPIVNYIEESHNSDIEIDLSSIVAIAEGLPDKTKKQLKHFFKCPVISRYSNMENGFIAQQCIEENNEYHINYASYFIEILDLNKDQPVKHGRLGRIVVTDLFNYAMPLIRYDTGDIGSLLPESGCSLKTPVLSEIHGRRVDLIYDPKGNIISPFFVVNTMWKYQHILQFQFIQESVNRYKLLLNCREKNIDVEYELLEELNQHLGEEAIIELDYVNEIPLLASGKRKQVVNATNHR